jgi:hypothetical protein
MAVALIARDRQQLLVFGGIPHHEIAGPQGMGGRLAATAAVLGRGAGKTSSSCTSRTLAVVIR